MSNYILGLLFENKLLRSSGGSFEQLFFDLMTRVYDSDRFTPVSPWGNSGDRGNDGFVQSEMRFFQLYAPNSISNNGDSPVDACNKAKVDFIKLKTRYPDIKNYHFVLNDKLKGVPEPIVFVHLEIQKANSQLVQCSPLGCHALRSKFDLLSEEKKVQIVGGVPSELPKDMDLSVLGELISSLAQSDEDDVSLDRLDLPAEFDAKAIFNGFSVEFQRRLTNYARRSFLVDRMLNARDASWMQSVSEEIKLRYLRLVDYDSADGKLLALIDDLVPVLALSNTMSVKSYRDAAFLVIAKYFETCDVFENPNAFNSTEAH